MLPAHAPRPRPAQGDEPAAGRCAAASHLRWGWYPPTRPPTRKAGVPYLATAAAGRRTSLAAYRTAPLHRHPPRGRPPTCEGVPHCAGLAVCAVCVQVVGARPSRHGEATCEANRRRFAFSHFSRRGKHQGTYVTFLVCACRAKSNLRSRGCRYFLQCTRMGSPLTQHFLTFSSPCSQAARLAGAAIPCPEPSPGRPSPQPALVPSRPLAIPFNRGQRPPDLAGLLARGLP
jgi:hypothetical protein